MPVYRPHVFLVLQESIFIADNVLQHAQRATSKILQLSSVRVAILPATNAPHSPQILAAVVKELDIYRDLLAFIPAIQVIGPTPQITNAKCAIPLV